MAAELVQRVCFAPSPALGGDDRQRDVGVSERFPPRRTFLGKSFPLISLR